MPEAVQSSICPQCGAPIDPRAAICKYCGADIPRQAAPQAPPPPRPPQYAPPQAPMYMPPQAPQYGAAAPAQYVNTSTKSKTTAGILAIFLGGIGVHKFYLGKIGMGILYLLFCWTYVPALVGLIEGIVYLCSSDETFYNKYARK